jgi:hypothetical protein
MANLNIELSDDLAAFRPGDRIEGRIAWELERAPESVELRLFWRTEGKGSRDMAVVHTERFSPVGARDARPFAIAAPASPHSFSGRLISLVWALEAVVSPGQEFARRDIVIAPGGEEILLRRTNVETSR